MSTLQDQHPRNWHSIGIEKDLTEFIDKIKAVSVSKNITFDQTLKAYELLEAKRANNLMVDNGDAHDEQMTGFGQILDSISNSLSHISDRE